MRTTLISLNYLTSWYGYNSILWHTKAAIYKLHRFAKAWKFAAVAAVSTGLTHYCVQFTRKNMWCTDGTPEPLTLVILSSRPMLDYVLQPYSEQRFPCDPQQHCTENSSVFITRHCVIPVSGAELVLARFYKHVRRVVSWKLRNHIALIYTFRSTRYRVSSFLVDLTTHQQE